MNSLRNVLFGVLVIALSSIASVVSAASSSFVNTLITYSIPDVNCDGTFSAPSTDSVVSIDGPAYQYGTPCSALWNVTAPLNTGIVAKNNLSESFTVPSATSFDLNTVTLKALNGNINDRTRLALNITTLHLDGTTTTTRLTVAPKVLVTLPVNQTSATRVTIAPANLLGSLNFVAVDVTTH